MYVPRSGIAGSYDNAILVLRNFILFSVVAAPVYDSTNSEGGFFSLHIFANICYTPFGDSQLTGMRHPANLLNL